MASCVTAYVSLALLLVHNIVHVITMPAAVYSDNGKENVSGAFLTPMTDKQFKEKSNLHHLGKAVKELEKNHFHWIDISQIINLSQTDTDLERELTDFDKSGKITDKSTDVKEIIHVDSNLSEIDSDDTVRDRKTAGTERPHSEAYKDRHIIGNDLIGNNNDFGWNGKISEKEIDGLLIATDLIRTMMDTYLESIPAGQTDEKSTNPDQSNRHVSKIMTDTDQMTAVGEKIKGASIGYLDQEADDEEDHARMEKELFENDATGHGYGDIINQLRQVAQREVAMMLVGKRSFGGCDTTRITYDMLMNYFKTGKFCNAKTFKLRFGVGK